MNRDQVAPRTFWDKALQTLAKAVPAISMTNDRSVVKVRYYEHEIFESGRSLIQETDKQTAMSEYDQRWNAGQEKSARLRALRLAKEATDCEAAAQAAATKSAAKKPAAKRRKTVAAMDAVSA